MDSNIHNKDIPIEISPIALSDFVRCQNFSKKALSAQGSAQRKSSLFAQLDAHLFNVATSHRLCDTIHNIIDDTFHDTIHDTK